MQVGEGSFFFLSFASCRTFFFYLPTAFIWLTTLSFAGKFLFSTFIFLSRLVLFLKLESLSNILIHLCRWQRECHCHLCWCHCISMVAGEVERLKYPNQNKNITRVQHFYSVFFSFLYFFLYDSFIFNQNFFCQFLGRW